MKKSITVILLALIFAINFSAQTRAVNKKSLLVTNCEETESICETQHLYRYDFVDGVFSGKEKILTTKTGDLRFDIGANRIYRNRYLLTNWGDVVDLETKKLLHKSVGEMIDTDGELVVIRVDREDVEGIFAFNLRTGEYSRLKSPNVYEVRGNVSPDRKFTAAGYESIVVTEIATGKKRIIKGKFDGSLSESANESFKLPIFWIDNRRILTQAANGDIRLVGVDGKIEKVVKMDVTDAPSVSPTFFRNRDGEIVYECGESFVIDVEGKKYRNNENIPLGSGFRAADDPTAKFDNGTKTIYYYRDAEIGRLWAIGSETDGGFLAVKYGEDGSNLGYPDGVKVWNDISKEWTTLEIKWSPQIVGWLN